MLPRPSSNLPPAHSTSSGSAMQTAGSGLILMFTAVIAKLPVTASGHPGDPSKDMEIRVI